MTHRDLDSDSFIYVPAEQANGAKSNYVIYCNRYELTRVKLS